ncbi:hypothetical protein AVEN_185570-1 [Araneus ventricosus]|uniref:Uncharacterized protein n=1 Tax=Araneus ventricosus TaxID=182803 RepID=A0A4Y2NP93_ARAVE|nr:hypothetical protein AVEN_185570-1 [Araneus ventricosus]
MDCRFIQPMEYLELIRRGYFIKTKFGDCGEDIGLLEHLIMRCKRCESYRLIWPKYWYNPDTVKLMLLASWKKNAAKIIELQLAFILGGLDID